MSYIEVISPGMYSSIQDFGRIGFRSYGVPLSGAMDQTSLKIGNSLLGNSFAEAAIEITTIGPKLLFYANTQIALTGADLSAQLNGVDIKTNVSYPVVPGDLLQFSKPKYGRFAYLCIKEGIKVQEHLGSKSTYPLAKLGQPLLSKGMKVYLDKETTHPSKSGVRIKPDAKHFDEGTINAFPGPEFDLLGDNFLNDSFEISPESNRMGFRFKGSKAHAHDTSILTSSVMPGTVQLPPSGEPIVLMRDCQTTGGYPRVLQLTDRSIDILSQKAPGSRMYFKLLQT
ncbi:MAG: biotin-dependent carboxyltransferase family protein [Cyclobacteriaceae bacterium]